MPTIASFNQAAALIIDRLMVRSGNKAVVGKNVHVTAIEFDMHAASPSKCVIDGLAVIGVQMATGNCLE